MACCVGNLIFDDWHTLCYRGQYWTDTFVYRIGFNDGIPPMDYARAIRSVALPLPAVRSSASLWVTVDVPPGGTWFIEQLRRSLRRARVPVAVTSSSVEQLPLMEFSRIPWVGDAPSPPPPEAEVPIPEDVTVAELGCLRVLARLEHAYAREVASLVGYPLSLVEGALGALSERGYVDYHLAAGHPYPVWTVRRRGVSVALRSWGVPAGAPFRRRKERRHGGKKKEKGAWNVGSRHIEISRMWPEWLREAWGRETVWTGWSEVYVGGHELGKSWGARPDALAWGQYGQWETLFWLEVESGNRSKEEMARKAVHHINKALIYIAPYQSVEIIIAFLAPPWVLDGIAARIDDADVPDRIAIVLADWRRFGELPVPEWGRVKML